MRRTNLGRARWVGVLVAGAALALGAAGPPSKSSSSSTKKKEPPPPKTEETIGSIASIIGSEYKVEGVGLVVGLDGTGSDPAPSWQRTKLLDEMRKSGVTNADKILRSKQVSMVTVRAIFPAGVTTDDKFDVELELAPGSATTSLAGGFLMTTQLAQRARTAEGEKDDKVIATAGGPVMTGNSAKPGDPKVGRALGGGRVKEDSLYVLSIKEARRSGRTSQLIQDRITTRFHQAEGLDQKGMAIAKTEALLSLKVPKVYHHNQARYHQIIKSLSLVDSPSLREQRLEKWGKDLLDPKKAGVAALELEGLGPGAAPTLRAALGSADEDVRFFAAESLAYLNDTEGDGPKVLAEVAKNRPEYRSFALKAMAATDQSASLLKLRSLMAEPDPELRYGAFDALRTLDPSDPFLGRRQVLDEPTHDPDDMMKAQIGPTRRKKPARREEPFTLFVVDCEGPPMVHVTKNIRCEVVVFGKDQRLLTPIVLGAGGPLLLNASDGDRLVQISRITERTLDAAPTKVSSPLDVAEVVRSLANVGASYPEVVSVIAAAAAQKNLPGPYVVDAIPASNKAYSEAQLAGAIIKKDNGLKKTGGDGDRKTIGERIQGIFRR